LKSVSAGTKDRKTDAVGGPTEKGKRKEKKKGCSAWKKWETALGQTARSASLKAKTPKKREG